MVRQGEEKSAPRALGRPFLNGEAGFDGVSRGAKNGQGQGRR